MRISAPARITVAAIVIGLVLPTVPALADPGHGRGHNGGQGHGQSGRPHQAHQATTAAATYSFDGSGNNVAQPTWGAAGIALLRTAKATYADGVSAPAGSSRPSARAISNALSAQESSIVNDRNLADFVYVWGQFIDHDIDLTESGTSESLPISVPTGDAWFDPTSTGTKTIGLKRSVVAAGTGTSASNPREQVNAVTAFIDGSQVYGSSKARADALRSFTGGQLRTSAGNMLPFNTTGLANANDSHVMPDSKLYLAGDVRVNENPDLISLQTLFMREHNRLAALQASAHPSWTDEQLYQAARRLVIAEIQSITFNEFLPALLGRQAVKPYQGYKSTVNPSITNEFATAAYRFGHSLLDSELGRLNNDGSEAAPPLSLAESFFNSGVFDPTKANRAGDIDPFLKAAATGNTQEVDLGVVDELRNMLFGPPGSGGFDLAALNIQRGRDHGLADYNSVRAAYGLSRVTSFAEITPDANVQRQLKDLYGSVDNIDLWVGGLAEKHLPGSSVGVTFQRIMVDQFSRLRDGDRNWYQSILRGQELGQIEGTRLSDVIRRNTSLTNLQPNVFVWKG
jgi:peroxidase